MLGLAPEQRDRLEQQGARERLLCRACEQQFAKLERYASLVFRGGAPGMHGERQGNMVYVSGIDYQKFKLFLLSLLWRAGAAQGRYFRRVTLGPHQERLRQMLHATEPGPHDLYPCIFWGLNFRPNEVPQLMVQPTKDKVWGRTTYHFVLPGFKLVYFVSAERLPPQQSQFVLQVDGSFVFQVRSVMELPTVAAFMQEYDNQSANARRGG